MVVEQKPFVYFKKEAERLGMENVKTASDLEIWCYIIKHQEKDNPLSAGFVREYCR